MDYCIPAFPGDAQPHFQVREEALVEGVFGSLLVPRFEVAKRNAPDAIWDFASGFTFSGVACRVEEPNLMLPFVAYLVSRTLESPR